MEKEVSMYVYMYKMLLSTRYC